MRISIANRVAIATTSLLITAVFIISAFQYQANVEHLALRESDRLVSGVKRLRDQIEGSVAELDRDVKLLADVPAVYGVMRAQFNGGRDPIDASTGLQWRTRLERYFDGVLRANPKYVRVELISLGEQPEHIVDISRIPRKEQSFGGLGGPMPWLDLEAVRGAPRQEPNSGLLLLAKGEDIGAEQRTLVQAAQIVETPVGDAFGIVVLSLDFSQVFAQFAETMPDGQESFLVDPERGIGIRSVGNVTTTGDIGIITRFPELRSPLREGKTFHGIVGGAKRGEIAYLTGLGLETDFSAQGIMVGAFASTDRVMAELPSIRQDLIMLAVLLALSGGSIIFVMSNVILRRLQTLTRATRVVSAGGNVSNIRLPQDSRDEIGALTENFRDMVAAIGQREEKLRDSEARMRSIVEAAGSAILSTDETGRIESANPAAGALFRASEKQLVGLALNDFLSPRDTKADGSLALQGIRCGKSVTEILPEGEIKARRMDGSDFPAHLSLGKVTLRDRVVFTAIITDLTETKKMERMKNEFVSTVSHELRTPLTSIRGSLGLLLSGALEGEVPGKAKSLIKIASDNSERLMRLINDILDIEKIEAGKLIFEFKPVNLAEQINQVVREISGFAINSGVNVAVDEIAGGLLVEADPDRLSQAVTNLVANAVKFSPKGETVAITVAPVKRDRVRISVQDRGPGISEAFQERIFEKFSQADSSDAREKGGTGLGLAISKSIVEAHGGSIGFDSEIGAGSTFWFELPLLKSSNASGAARRQRNGHVDPSGGS